MFILVECLFFECFKIKIFTKILPVAKAIVEDLTMDAEHIHRFFKLLKT